MKGMPKFVVAALVLMTILLLPSAAALAGPRPTITITVPCGERAQVFLDYYPWTPTPRTHRLTFDASGGGTVHFYVVPYWASVSIPNDNVTRSYSVNLANIVDSPHPVGRQVLATANAAPCLQDLTISNVAVTVVDLSDHQGLPPGVSISTSPNKSP